MLTRRSVVSTAAFWFSEFSFGVLFLIPACSKLHRFRRSFAGLLRPSLLEYVRGACPRGRGPVRWCHAELKDRRGASRTSKSWSLIWTTGVEWTESTLWDTYSTKLGADLRLSLEIMSIMSIMLRVCSFRSNFLPPYRPPSAHTATLAFRIVLPCAPGPKKPWALAELGWNVSSHRSNPLNPGSGQKSDVLILDPFKTSNPVDLESFKFSSSQNIQPWNLADDAENFHFTFEHFPVLMIHTSSD